MSGTLAYRLRIQNEANDADAFVFTSLRAGPNPYIAEPPSAEGSTLDPVAGKVTVGATTVLVTDPLAEIEVINPSTTGADDDFEGYADTAALAAVYSVTTGTSANTFTLNTTDGVGGGQCAQISLLTTNTNLAGGAGRSRTFTGYTPAALYRVTLEARRISANTDHNVVLRVNGRATSSIPADNLWHTLTMYAAATSTGALTVSFGYVVDGGDSAPPATTVFDNLTITGLTAVGPSTVTSRIVTAALGDPAGRQQLLSRLAIVEETEDLGENWDNYSTGYVNNIRLVDGITYEFTVGESKRIEQASRVFDRISDPVKDADFMGIFDRASCIIGGPIIGDFGPTHDRGRPVFRVTQTTVTQEGDTFVALQFESGFLYHGAIPASQAPVDQLNRDFFDSHAKDYLDEASAQHAADVVLLAPLANVVVRIYDAGTGEWIADHDAAMEQIDLSAFRDWRFITEDGTIIARWHGAAPAIGTRYALAVFPTEMSEKNPLHLTGHPVDLYTQLATLKGITYNSASATAVKTALGADMIVNMRVTAGDTFEEWTTKCLFGPFGFTVRTDAAGDRELITTRIRPAAVPTTVITNDELLSPDGDVFHVDEESAAIKVTFQSLAFRTMTERLESTPIDAIQGTKITVELTPDDPVTIFGDREIRFEIPGQIAGLSKGALTTQVAYTVSTTDPGATGPLSFWLDISGGTTIETGAVLKRRDLGNGSWIEWNDIHTPITTTAELLAIIASQVSAGSLDLWVVDQYACLFDWQGRGEITGEIQVRRGVVSELVGDEIVLDLAHNPTGSPDQIPSMQRGTIPRRCQILRRTPAPEGQKLLVKDRGPAVVDGAVTPPVFITCGDIDPPTGIAVDMVGTTATLIWANGDATLEVEVSIRLATDDSLIVIAVLPGGSTTYTYTLPSESTEYTFAVRHVDAPPLHCVSETDEVNGTTGTFLTLLPPIDPAAFSDGKGTFGLAVTAIELAASVEFWFAPETSAGSGLAGTYVLYATKASVANGRTTAQTGIAPNDGTLRYLIARHVESGFTPSDFTTPVSINPWLLIPPVDPVPPVVPPLGLTILPVPITLITGTVPLGLRAFPEAATRLTPWRGTEKHVPAAGATAAHIGASILATTVSVGGFIAIQYQHPCRCEWDYLDGEGGPILPVDSASLDVLDACAAGDPWVVAGAPVNLVDDATTAVRFRAVGLGGTATEDLVIAELTVWLTTRAADLPPPEMPEPPIDPPQTLSCADAALLDGFEYANVAAMTSAGWSASDTLGATSTPSIVTSPVTQGAKAFKVAVSGAATAAQHYTATLRPTGYEIGVPIRFLVDVITEQTGTEGPGDTFDDDFSGYANTAALDVVWPFSHDFSPLASSTLNATGGPTGGKCIEITKATADSAQPAFRTHTITGMPPGASYTVTAKLWKDWDDRQVADGGDIPNGHSPDGNTIGVHAIGGLITLLPQASDSTWVELVATGNVNGLGVATAAVGWVGIGSGAMEATRRVRVADVSVVVDGAGTDPILFLGLQVGGGDTVFVSASSALTSSDVTLLQADGIVEGDGGIDVTLVVEADETATYARALNVFDNLRVCFDLVGDPTGNGDDDDAPFPTPPPGGYPPPPVGGDRPFMIHDVSAGGLGFWDGTVKALTLANVLSTLQLASANGAMDCFRFGGDQSKLDASGRFSYDLWQVQVDAIWNDPTARAALIAAIASGAAWCHYLLDEPFHPRWGGISLQTMDRMATYSKSLYPTWRTLFRVKPTDSRLARAIVNCDTYWAEYNLPKGDVTAYRDVNAAAAEAMGKGIVMGVHYDDFPAVGSNIYITPDQLRHYGGILASSTSPAVVAMGGWKYTSAGYGQSGMPAAVQFVRDLFASHDP